MPQGTRRPSTSPSPTAAPDARLRGLAAKTDRYLLYQRAVQCVEAEIDFVDDTFTKLRGRKAVLLREDFCGTLHTSCEWIRRRKGNIAAAEPTAHPPGQRPRAGAAPQGLPRL